MELSSCLHLGLSGNPHFRYFPRSASITRGISGTFGVRPLKNGCQRATGLFLCSRKMCEFRHEGWGKAGPAMPTLRLRGGEVGGMCGGAVGAAGWGWRVGEAGERYGGRMVVMPANAGRGVLQPVTDLGTFFSWW